jgi:flagellar protein FliS
MSLDAPPSMFTPQFATGSSARDTYLATEVTTAPPQKLQLMLLDAALRHGRKAREAWREGREEEASESLIRCQDIVSSLLGGMNPEHDRELARRVAGVYLFIYRSLTEANFNRDAKKLDEALSILEIERDTWQQVCLQLGSRQRPAETRESGLSFDA